MLFHFASYTGIPILGLCSLDSMTEGSGSPLFPEVSGLCLLPGHLVEPPVSPQNKRKLGTHS